MKGKALFIDRDGVINVDRVHVSKKEDFEFTRGIFELCRKYSESGYLIFIITNQAGIAKGLYTEEEFSDLMEWVTKEFQENGVTISGVYHCPHHPDYTGSCFCRKPEPGMVLKAASDFSISLRDSVLIGDKETDIEAGRRASIPEENMLLLQCHPADFRGRWPGL